MIDAFFEKMWRFSRQFKPNEQKIENKTKVIASIFVRWSIKQMVFSLWRKSHRLHPQPKFRKFILHTRNWTFSWYKLENSQLTTQLPSWYYSSRVVKYHRNQRRKKNPNGQMAYKSHLPIENSMASIFVKHNIEKRAHSIMDEWKKNQIKKLRHIAFICFLVKMTTVGPSHMTNSPQTQC